MPKRKSINGDRIKVKAREESFARQFIILNLNGTAAAVAAGYSRSTAGSKAEQLLKKEGVKALIRQLLAEQNKKLDFSVEKTVRQIVLHATGDVRTLFNSDGSFKRLEDLTADAAALIGGLELDGKGKVKHVKRTDAVRALDMLARYHKLFAEDRTIQDTGVRVIVLDMPRPLRDAGAGAHALPAPGGSNGNGHNGNGNGSGPHDD